jgi:hypothetical protein
MPPAFIARCAAVERAQRDLALTFERGEAFAHAQHRRFAIDVGDAVKAQVSASGGDDGRRAVLDDGARYGAAAAVEHGNIVHQQQTVAKQRLRNAKRVAIGTEIERRHLPCDIFRRRVPVDRRGGRRTCVLAEEARRCLRQRLAARQRRVQIGGERGKAAQTGLETFGIERQRGFAILDNDRLACQQVAAVDVLGHQMPGHAMLGLASQQRPGRRVEPGVGGQRAVVEIDRGARCERENVGRENG